MDLKQEIIKILETHGLKLGCYNLDSDQFTEYQKKRIIEELTLEMGVDKDIKFRNFVIEVWYVDSEVDFEYLTKEEYKRYL